MNSIGMKSSFSDHILSELRSIQDQARQDAKVSSTSSDQDQSDSFLQHLENNISEVNQLQKSADKMAVDVASGKQQNLHEVMLATTQAELGFNLMVQVRNRVLEAYQEVMRMPV